MAALACMAISCGSDGGAVPADSSWDIVAVSGTVAMQTTAGAAWDALGGAPDPVLCATFNAARTCTPVASDTFTASWNRTLVTGAGGAALMQGVLFDYYDEDLAVPDPFLQLHGDLL